MTNQNHRDDSFKNRLSSFLKQNADLKLMSIQPIKENVFKVQDQHGKDFILKGNKSIAIVRQQWRLFKNLTSCQKINKYVPFNNGEAYIEGFGMVWTISPFIKGETLHFAQERDRKEALATMMNFHDVSKGVTITNPLIRNPLYIKWNKRLEKLKYSRGMMERLGFLNLYEDILTTTEKQLMQFESFHWYEIENYAASHWTWIHGDVASHNFIRDKQQHVHLIDFDLLSLSPHIYDHIQLGQRFLPYLNWDKEQLLNYCTFKKEEEILLWLYGVSIPSDIIREWWNFYKKKPTIDQTYSFLENLAINWHKRKQFVEAVERMLI